MPIYEYQCEACDHAFEALRKISEPPLVACPQCNKDTLRKKVSAAAFRLKGGGWYETDFKTSGKKNLASGSGDSASTGSGDSAPSGSGDSAPSGSSEKSTEKKPSGDSSSNAKA